MCECMCNENINGDRQHQPVMSEEDVVPLVVKSDNSSPLKLGVMGEKCSQHACHCVA